MTPRFYVASLLALLSQHVAGNSLPYNPTRVFVPPNATYAYIFEPVQGSVGQSRLLSLDLTNTFTTTQTTFVTLSDSLPFLQEGELLPFTPTIDTAGNITATTGNCSSGGDGLEVWRFTKDSDNAAAGGTWSQYRTTLSDLGTNSASAGPNFLSSGIAFSEDVEETGMNTDVFVFGGMCPLANSTPTTWTTSAEYSNVMLSLSPDVSSQGASDYSLGLATNRGPPIAEAGFSITSLPPAYSINSSGLPQTQSQDFVLLGGHTQSAFINMSQVALFSLPQASWAFLPVTQPPGGQTDLAVRQSATVVEPRSGHTAVLSQDGTSLIVFGGWVGDVDTPAQPQLAVLSFGSGFGGSGDWTWSVPTQSGSGLSAGTGMYGHGAAMLPGGIMMIVGGFTIPAPSSASKLKRDGLAASSQVLLYNTTANAWITSYAPPSNFVAQSPEEATGKLSRKSQKIGLGAGLAIGALILVLLVIFYFWYTRRLKKARANRERMLLSRSSDGSFGQADQPFLSQGGIDGRGGDAAAVGRFWNVWDHDAGSYPPRPEMHQQSGIAGATGLFVNVPSPTRGLRKGVAGKNFQYHAAPRYDDKRISRGSGNITTITEHEEEESQEATRRRQDSDELTDAERKLKEVERVLCSSDPFSDDGEPNPLGSHPVSPELADTEIPRRTPVSNNRASGPPIWHSIAERTEQSNWPLVSEHAVRDSTGRVSPAKSNSDERTSSTLSERSQRSNVSTNSMTRTMSTRTGALLAAAAAARFSANESPTDERTHTMSTNEGRKSPFYYTNRGRASTNGTMQISAPLSASTDADSFTTAKTDFAKLQSEGEALLGGRPAVDRDDPYQRALAAHSTTAATPRLGEPFSAGDRLPMVPSRRKPGWMGSLRRAINAVATGDRSFSFTSYSEQYAEHERASSTSPTKHRVGAIGDAPRRAVSDGGALLRQKRGRADWEDPTSWPPYRDEVDDDDWGAPVRRHQSAEQSGLGHTHRQGEDDEWDVEGAAARRDVQVMFTIPKTRLRIVNATDLDRASLRSASEGALSRSESLKSTLRRDDSTKEGPRARSDGDKGSVLLPPTVEESLGDGRETTNNDTVSGWQAEKEKEKAA